MINREPFETEVTAITLNVLQRFGEHVDRGRAGEWRALSRAWVNTAGGILIDTQRAAALDVLARFGSNHPSYNETRTLWRGTGFPGRGTDIVEAANTIAYTSRLAWAQLRRDGLTSDTLARQRFIETLYGPHRAVRIGRTEVTRAITTGTIIAVEWLRRRRIRIELRWVTSDDERVCPECGPLHQQPQAIWKRVFPKGTPAHVQCRCELRPSRV